MFIVTEYAALRFYPSRLKSCCFSVVDLKPLSEWKTVQTQIRLLCTVHLGAYVEILEYLHELYVYFVKVE